MCEDGALVSLGIFLLVMHTFAEIFRRKFQTCVTSVTIAILTKIYVYPSICLNFVIKYENAELGLDFTTKSISG